MNSLFVKNWSLIYPDGRTAELAPADDYVSTIPYLPNDKLALNLGTEKNLQTTSLAHFKKLAVKAPLPEYLVIQTIKETAANTLARWREEKSNYPLPRDISERIESHMLMMRLT